MCKSPIYGLHYELHSIFKHTNELYYCNLLNDESIQKINNKKSLYRCIGGMICFISKFYKLNLTSRHYFALLMTITVFFLICLELDVCQVVYLNFAQIYLKKKVSFC